MITANGIWIADAAAVGGRCKLYANFSAKVAAAVGNNPDVIGGVGGQRGEGVGGKSGREVYAVEGCRTVVGVGDVAQTACGGVFAFVPH